MQRCNCGVHKLTICNCGVHKLTICNCGVHKLTICNCGVHKLTICCHSEVQNFGNKFSYQMLRVKFDIIVIFYCNNNCWLY